MYPYYFLQASFSIASWKIIFLWMLPFCRAESDGMFECGAHGRFEYCIDGIPGCVIGCHCHPGYYFDTETKICEPNTKLTQNYRRYIPEPTRIQNPTFLSEIQTESLPVLTTRNIIDEHVNDITNNADDLGDWLYNQFFKTIENQVINNTNKDNQLTRRSGRGSVPKHSKLKRRSRRKGNRHKKKKKGLKGKLLRIAEDDSMFESSDSSDSDSSPYSSQSSTSYESDSDEDHGHKKIVLINKKPRPPLPSFIFLPNMNTPFYPPIGLPPPPVMPMYPMVPVPPMMPAPPFQGQIPECNENTTTAKTEITTTSTTNLPKTTAELSTKSAVVTTTNAQNQSVSMDTPAQRSHYKKRRRKKPKLPENIPDEEEEPPIDSFPPNLDSRQMFIKQLRQKINYPPMNEPASNRHIKPFDYPNQLMPPNALIDNEFVDNGVPKIRNSPPVNLEDTSELENVDFKYLSQLIHRVKENQTQDVPERVYNTKDFPKKNIPPEWSKKKYHDFSVPLMSGRRTNIKSSRNNQADDSYYSNLGRQIATLIRTIDADNEKVEIEKVQQKNNDHLYFNDNGPRTFWERSVRSPLKSFHYFKTKFKNPIHSNELLLNIENKVETIASTVSTLSLQEIENMINVMEAARMHFQTENKFKNIKPSPKTFNINLWPQDIKQFNKPVKSSTNPIYDMKRSTRNYLNNTRREVINYKLNEVGKEHLYPFTDRVNVNTLKNHFKNLRLPIQPAKMYLKPLHNTEDVRILHSTERHRHGVIPTLLNFKNMKKYFFDESNHYSFQNDDLRFKYLPVKRPKANKQQKESLPSPYFHHEINHVDYIS